MSTRPIDVPPSLHWDGIDGAWSTFYVQVGNPGQSVRLLPGTSASASDTTWVVRPEGCTQANPNLTECDDSRGMLFDPEKSTSWSTERLDNGGLFELNTWYEGFLNLTGNAYYGFDTLSLGLSDSNLPSLDSQLIAGMATNNYWLGYLGLSPIPFNFSSSDNSSSMRDPQPSFLSALRNQSVIPSLSWAYTAGAAYRDDPVFGSVVLGGYDTSRFEENNVTFAFAADFSRDLTVYLQSVSYDAFEASPLLTESIPVFINSVVTHLWLPTDVCKRFEEAFNLTWSDTAQLYLVDDESHSRLSSLNPTITFTLGHANSEGGSVEVSLPYGAFDLSGSPPFVDPPSKYFPLKRATKADQYTLGRVFLQGAYVIADYERQTFSVSQALFPDASRVSNSTIVAIYPIGSEQASQISAGKIAGIVVGAVAGIFLLGALVWWWMRRRKSGKASVVLEKESAPEMTPFEPELDGQDPRVHEMEEARPKFCELGDLETKRLEMDGSGTKFLELDSQAEQKVELEGKTKRVQVHELP